MTDMIISIDDEATLGTKCPTHKLEIKERKMTSKETIQQTKEDIAVLQKKLKKLEELEIQKSKSPVEKAFKEVYGYYPEGCERSVWFAFQKGYIEAHKDAIENNKNFEPTPQEPAKDKVPLYTRFTGEGAYGQIYFDAALRVVRSFLVDEAVIENEDHEYITFTLQKSLLEFTNV
jgi:hypothetical protein